MEIETDALVRIGADIMQQRLELDMLKIQIASLKAVIGKLHGLNKEKMERIAPTPEKIAIWELQEQIKILQRFIMEQEQLDDKTFRECLASIDAEFLAEI